MLSNVASQKHLIPTTPEPSPTLLQIATLGRFDMMYDMQWQPTKWPFLWCITFRSYFWMCRVFWRIQHLSCRHLFWRHLFYPNSLSLPWWDAIREGREAYETALLSSFHWLLLWMIAGHLLKMNCEFSILKIKSEINPLDLGSYIWESWHIIHHTKPTQGGYMEVKGFQDPSTYSWEK